MTRVAFCSDICMKYEFQIIINKSTCTIKLHRNNIYYAGTVTKTCQTSNAEGNSLGWDQISLLCIQFLINIKSTVDMKRCSYRFYNQCKQPRLGSYNGSFKCYVMQLGALRNT